jgi:hypothetical protein
MLLQERKPPQSERMRRPLPSVVLEKIQMLLHTRRSGRAATRTALSPCRQVVQPMAVPILLCGLSMLQADSSSGYAAVAARQLESHQASRLAAPAPIISHHNSPDGHCAIVCSPILPPPSFPQRKGRLATMHRHKLKHNMEPAQTQPTLTRGCLNLWPWSQLLTC